MSGRIEIRALRATGHHGVHEEERAHGQPFVVDADIDIDPTAAAASDHLADTVDYGRVVAALAEAVRRTQFQLIEALAGHLADIVLGYDRVRAVRIRVAKPEVPMEEEVGEVAVVVHRSAS